MELFDYTWQGTMKYGKKRCFPRLFSMDFPVGILYNLRCIADFLKFRAVCGKIIVD